MGGIRKTHHHLWLSPIINWSEVAEVEELLKPDFTHHNDIAGISSISTGKMVKKKKSSLGHTYFGFNSEHRQR